MIDWAIGDRCRLKEGHCLPNVVCPLMLYVVEDVLLADGAGVLGISLGGVSFLGCDKVWLNPEHFEQVRPVCDQAKGGPK